MKFSSSFGLTSLSFRVRALHSVNLTSKKELCHSFTKKALSVLLTWSSSTIEYSIYPWCILEWSPEQTGEGVKRQSTGKGFYLGSKNYCNKKKNLYIHKQLLFVGWKVFRKDRKSIQERWETVERPQSKDSKCLSARVRWREILIHLYFEDWLRRDYRIYKTQTIKLP